MKYNKGAWTITMNLHKLLENGNLVLLAAYIKAESGCSDEQAMDKAYELCDALATRAADGENRIADPGVV